MSAQMQEMNAICITPFDEQYRNLTIESIGIHPVHVGYVIAFAIRQAARPMTFALQQTRFVATSRPETLHDP